ALRVTIAEAHRTRAPRAPFDGIGRAFPPPSRKAENPGSPNFAERKARACAPHLPFARSTKSAPPRVSAFPNATPGSPPGRRYGEANRQADRKQADLKKERTHEESRFHPPRKQARRRARQARPRGNPCGHRPQ